MARLPSIKTTCTPREDVLAGGLSDDHFAAQLDQIVRDPAGYPVYGDPDEFFAVTYPTDGLRRLLESTFARLSGKKARDAEHGVIRFETSFGGGKTHGLIAVYHLAEGARPANLDEFMDPGVLPDNCQVAAVVADSLDAVAGADFNGHSTLTMWGAIAAQLGDEAWERLQINDETRSAPSKTAWVKIFEDTPTVVIIGARSSGHNIRLNHPGDCPPQYDRIIELVDGDYLCTREGSGDYEDVPMAGG